MTHTATDMEVPVTWGFGDFFSRYPAQVCIVTTQTSDGRPTGSTCTAVMALSDSPPSLVVSFMISSNTLKHIRRSGEFGVNAMGVGGENVVRRFATKNENKFDGIAWHDPNTDANGSGVMISQGVLGYVHCHVNNLIEVGDHTLVVGSIQSVFPGDRPTALLYAQRKMWLPTALSPELPN